MSALGPSRCVLFSSKVAEVSHIPLERKGHVALHGTGDAGRGSTATRGAAKARAKKEPRMYVGSMESHLRACCILRAPEKNAECAKASLGPGRCCPACHSALHVCIWWAEVLFPSAHPLARRPPSARSFPALGFGLPIDDGATARMLVRRVPEKRWR